MRRLENASKNSLAQNGAVSQSLHAVSGRKDLSPAKRII